MQNRTQFAQWGILSLFVVVFVFFGVRYYWTFPAPSDPLQYIGNVPWGATWGYFPWLDRITLAVGLGLFGLLPIPVYTSGPAFILFCSTITLILGCWWLMRQGGYWAALFFAVLYCSSNFTLFAATQIYPRTVVTLWSLLTFITFYEGINSTTKWSRLFFGLAGFSAALTVFSKATGIILVVYCVLYLCLKRDLRRHLLIFLLGNALGTLFVCLLFIGLYDWPSFVNTTQSFFNSNLRQNFAGRTNYNNIVSFLDVVLDKKYLPGFLALLVCVGAYRHKPSKALMVFAWLYIAIVYFIYYVGTRGFLPLPHYIYTAYIFSILAMALHHGSQLKSPVISLNLKIFAGLVMLACVLYGNRIGIRNNPLGIFTSSMLGIDQNIGRFYGLGVLFAAVGLLVLEQVKRRGAFIAFYAFIGIWSTAYAGGCAYHFFHAIQKPLSAFYYANAPIFNKFPQKQFGVYVQNWPYSNTTGASKRIPRLLWVYRIFFDEKYERGTGHDAQYKNDKLIHASIKILESSSDISVSKSPFLLTDSLDAVKRAGRESEIRNEFLWHGIPMYVVEFTNPPISISPKRGD